MIRLFPLFYPFILLLSTLMRFNAVVYKLLSAFYLNQNAVIFAKLTRHFYCHLSSEWLLPSFSTNLTSRIIERVVGKNLIGNGNK